MPKSPDRKNEETQSILDKPSRAELLRASLDLRATIKADQDEIARNARRAMAQLNGDPFAVVVGLFRHYPSPINPTRRSRKRR